MSFFEVRFTGDPVPGVEYYIICAGCHVADRMYRFLFVVSVLFVLLFLRISEIRGFKRIEIS